VETVLSKIVYSEIVQQPQFFADLEGRYYPEASSFQIICGSGYLKFLLGVLHSSAFTFFFRHYYSGGGLGTSGYRYKKAYLEKTPIPLIIEENCGLVKQIEGHVEKVLIKKQNSKDSSEEENKIDDLVCQLYQLTEEESAFIRKAEESNRK